MIKSIKEIHEDTVFNLINYSLLILVVLVIVYPLYFIIIASISNPNSVALNQVALMPKGFTLESYSNVFQNSIIWIGYRNTILYTTFGTLFNLALTIPCAYTFSKKDLPGRRPLMFLFTFTMYFSGGLIPTYLLVKSLRLPNTPFVLILLSGLSVYNLIITRTYFENSIPGDLYEAARIDGYSEIKIFLKIALPLAGPIIAVMSLYYAVGHWNSFFNALIYLTKEALYPLQLILRNILLQNSILNIAASTLSDDEALALAQKANMVETMKYALIFISSFPVLCAYPFVQKYFIKGAMIGAVKG
ncbi:MAG: carbohydrate ABC transporter permease [Treponema sp.]|nr:carbohydrate ABC transporter permease [Treponema sp.]